MQQQPMPQPRDEYEWQSSSYTNRRAGSEYDEGYKGNAQYNDQLAEAIVQRMRQEFRSGIHPSGRGASSGQRLALAIVSLSILVPLVAIILGTSVFTGLFAIFGLALVCLAIIVVNVTFNMMN